MNEEEIAIERNIGEIFKCEGNLYKKVKESVSSMGCNECVTYYGGEICLTAGDCRGVTLQIRRSYIEIFKQL